MLWGPPTTDRSTLGRHLPPVLKTVKKIRLKSRHGISEFGRRPTIVQSLFRQSRLVPPHTALSTFLCDHHVSCSSYRPVPKCPAAREEYRATVRSILNSSPGMPNPVDNDGHVTFRSS